MFEWSYNVHLLNYAILLNDIETVGMLLSTGINPRHKENGLTPFDIVTKGTHKKILKLLSEQLNLSAEQKQLFEEFLTTGKAPFYEPGDLFTAIPAATAAASKGALPESTEDVLKNPLFTDPDGTMSVLGEVG